MRKNFFTDACKATILTMSLMFGDGNVEKSMADDPVTVAKMVEKAGPEIIVVKIDICKKLAEIERQELAALNGKKTNPQFHELEDIYKNLETAYDIGNGEKTPVGMVAKVNTEALNASTRALEEFIVEAHNMDDDKRKEFLDFGIELYEKSEPRAKKDGTALDVEGITASVTNFTAPDSDPHIARPLKLYPLYKMMQGTINYVNEKEYEHKAYGQAETSPAPTKGTTLTTAPKSSVRPIRNNTKQNLQRPKKIIKHRKLNKCVLIQRIKNNRCVNDQTR